MLNSIPILCALEAGSLSYYVKKSPDVVNCHLEAKDHFFPYYLRSVALDGYFNLTLCFSFFVMFTTLFP